MTTRRRRGEDGISFEHRGPCRDPHRHRHCPGLWRGEITVGYTGDGTRTRRKGQPPGGRLNTRRLTRGSCPPTPEAIANPGTAALPPDNLTPPQTLATTQARVRRAPAEDPFFVSVGYFPCWVHRLLRGVLSYRRG